jgi:nitrite reductase/ring-hydroxylating ferredoxin subunit
VAYVKLITLESCRPDAGTFVEHGDREFAVFRWTDPDRVAVTDNACPHASGNLSGGEVQGSVVTCPWHHWEFDLESGRCTHSDKAAVHKYRAEIRDGVVWVELA